MTSTLLTRSTEVERTTELTGRVALVTGAAGDGLGQAIARRLVAEGAIVAVTDIHERRTVRVAESIARDNPDSRVAGYTLDVANRHQVDDVVGAVTAELGPIQILVNNAAIDITGTIFDYSSDDWDRLVAVNLSGPWYLCRQIVPIMREAGSGVVINIGSIAADVGGSGFEGCYAVTKGGLHALTKSIARDGGSSGIRAVTISPGIISDTRVVLEHPEICDHPDVRSILGTFPNKDEIARVVAFMAGDAARHITGTIIEVTAGAYMRP